MIVGANGRGMNLPRLAKSSNYMDTGTIGSSRRAWWRRPTEKLPRDDSYHVGHTGTMVVRSAAANANVQRGS